MKKLQQFNIISLTYSRLENNNFSIELSPLEASENEELIALADSEVLRLIRKITNHPFNEKELSKMLEERKRISKEENTDNRRFRIRGINDKICEFLFIPEYISIETPNKKNYKKVGKEGFFVNGVKYKRLLCGAGHARTNRTMFCAEYIYNELNDILCCGSNVKEIVPAKWNAYYALVSSATYRVTQPRVCVVPDKEIKMVKTVDWVTEDDYQDKITRCEKELNFNLFDGMGLIAPKFAEIWAKDLELDYLPSAFCIRSPFIKGMVAVFDFHKFSNEVAKKYIIKDLYGNEVDVFDIDIILTQSQFKLWNAYKNWQDYLCCLEKSTMQWGVSKFSPKKDVDYVRTNYQFLQVLELDDNDIEELCKPTIEWIKCVIGNNTTAMQLYLMGKIADCDDKEKKWNNIQDNFLKSLLLDKRLVEDNYIKNRITKSLNKRIKEGYIGKLIIKGNFQTMFADPYALCEHIFGLEVKGLLEEFEHYSYYWTEKNVDKVCAMRSPLTWKSEINLLNFKNNPKIEEWYKYIKSGIIYNVWGCDNMIHAGSDFDGDIVCTTDNKYFLKGRSGGAPVAYQPQKAKKHKIIK